MNRNNMLIAGLILLCPLTAMSETPDDPFSDFEQQAQTSVTKLKTNVNEMNRIDGLSKVRLDVKEFAMSSMATVPTRLVTSWSGTHSATTGELGYLSIAFEVNFLLRQNPNLTNTAGGSPTSVTFVVKDASNKVVLTKTETLKYDIEFTDGQAAPLNFFLNAGNYAAGLKAYSNYSIECQVKINNARHPNGKTRIAFASINSATLTVLEG